jgi:hypothetical protein
MKKPLPHEGLTRPGPGDQDIPDPSADVEGHSLIDQDRKPFDQGVPGAPGSDALLGNLPGTGGEYQEDRGPDEL